MASADPQTRVTTRRSPVSARSDHVSVLERNKLYVWGGIRCEDGTESLLPSDEMRVYDLLSGVWSQRCMGGDVPPSLSQTCGAYLQGVLYIFAGCDSRGYSNQMYCVDLSDEEYSWRKVTDTVGVTPSPRIRHSCWVYRNRLVYFGGYGCKTAQDINNSKTFLLDENSRATVGSAVFQFWGWNNEVHVFEPESATWTEPQTQGQCPEPRSAHAAAVLGHTGYICGGLERQKIDMYCLDLRTWMWTQIEPETTAVPRGRTLHSLTAISDHKLFLFGGLSDYGGVLSDGWEFDSITKEWREREHTHTNKPRLWHSADKGRDGDVVVFGGSQTFNCVMDSVVVLRSLSQIHCGDVLLFQTQPHSLTRLCEDCIGKHMCCVSWLPAKLQKTVSKRIFFFSDDAQNKHDSSCF